MADGILFKIDSPGGYCAGGDECAKIISECGIPKVAFTEQACSMAYYLASGCDIIVSTRTSLNGNIGVIMPWVDSSKLWELNGLEFDAITNEGADLKSAFHGPSITKEQRAFAQEQANILGKMFRDHVEAHRVVCDEVWRAGWYFGERAVELGLIDQVGREEDAVMALEFLISEQPAD
jgi:protease-4